MADVLFYRKPPGPNHNLWCPALFSKASEEQDKTHQKGPSVGSFFPTCQVRVSRISERCNSFLVLLGARTLLGGSWPRLTPPARHFTHPEVKWSSSSVAHGIRTQDGHSRWHVRIHARKTFRWLESVYGSKTVGIVAELNASRNVRIDAKPY